MKDGIRNVLSYLIVLILFCTSLIGNAQSLCGNAVNAPTTINGIDVTGAGFGSVDVYPTEFSSCFPLITTPVNSLYLGGGGFFSYTYTFSEPVNDLVIIITAAGQFGDENFIFSTNGGGIPTIADLQSCFSSIVGNQVFSGAGGDSNGGGGVFVISNSNAYTTLTITGDGGNAGSLVALCDASVVPDTCLSGESDLIVTQTVNNSNPLVGCEVEFTVNVTNDGPCDAITAEVLNTIPSGLTVVSATPSIGSVSGSTWSIGNLNSGSSANLVIIATVNSSSSQTLTSSATSVSNDSILSNNVSNLTIIPTLDPPNAGSDSTISICSNSINAILLDSLLTLDSDLNGSWTEISTISSGQFNTTSHILSLNTIAPGTYLFKYKVGNGCGSDSSVITINIIATPELTPVADQNLCSSYTLPVISGTNLSGNEAYFTGLNGSGTQFDAGQIISSSIDLYVFDQSNGTLSCSSEQFFSIEILAPTILNLSATPTSGSAPLIVNISSNTENANNFAWFLDETYEGSVLNNATFDSSGVYVITLIAWQNDPSCADTAMISIVVYDSLIVDIPNVFTPNGDGVNDFYSVTLNQDASYQFSIINRWGIEIASGENKLLANVPAELWKGIDANDGVYFLAIEFNFLDGKTVKKQSFITVTH